ncbi:homoserine kinase [Demetria terragena]|uniref:homoserine kinase n=1 Tax=Demetria terragena TaxID=63959 RepID=UPI00039D2F63|nr:homoserine kinase [Demetria terragena]
MTSDTRAESPVPSGQVRLEVPASSANLGPGFDSIGMAIDLWDSVEVEIGGDQLLIECEGEGAAAVPRDRTHLVFRSMSVMWHGLGYATPSGVVLRCRNAIPHSRGLGSSAAAIVAGVTAAAALVGIDPNSATGRQLIGDVAGDLEGHPDNSSASVYGGITVSWANDDGNGWRTAQLTPHADLRAIAFVPDRQLATDEARAALPTNVGHGDAGRNSGRAGLLTHALTQDPSYLLPATREWLHQEQRRAAYPASMHLVDRLRSAGHAAVISGAGPTVLVLTTSGDQDTVLSYADEVWNPISRPIPDTGVRAHSRR